DDKAHTEKYSLAGQVNILPDSSYDIRFADQLLLHYKTFHTGDNLIQWTKNGLASARLHLTADDQLLEIQTGTGSGKLPPVLVNLDRFRLSTITGLLGQDSAMAEALINGKISAENLDQSPVVTADITLKDIVAESIPVGDLAATLHTPAPGQYQIEANLTGFDNDVQVKGIYADALDFDVLLNRLNLRSIEPFAMGQARRLKGYANGRLKLSGTTSKPQVTGELGFTGGQANITMINTTLLFPAEKLVFDEKGMAFNQFTLTDSLGGSTSINGRINTTDYTDYAFDLKIAMDNFNLLGPKANEDQLYYGPAFIDSKISVTGNLNRPVVDMQVSLRDKSNITVTIPETEPGLEDRDGVIVFVNRANPVDSSLLKKQEPAVTQTGIKGIDLSAAIDISKSSTLNIIIDPVNGDYLEAKGNASLNFTIDPSSKMSLTGRYEIDEGKYEMSLNQLIKRSFTLEKGSSITWDGEITRAQLDITAKYLVRAPAIDLLAGQVQDADNRQYQQRIPVEVYLMIKDELLKPTISFRLDMPEKDQSIFQNKAYLRIKQINTSESQINKQVMGLLVLQSFIADDPLSTLDQRAGGSVTDAAKQSVSKILSQQLNNLAGKLIKGVDLNFDLQSQEDYSSGSKAEKTTLNVGASKSLFNDRLTVAVGSNIDLSGNSQGNASSLIGDVTIDYAITRDGRYKLRAFQRNQTDAILQGQIIETGLTFMLVMDYDEFKEILRRSKEEKELIKEKRKSET
ncbi:MAG: translocation/assembly module TamB domain-containing protein, partial [Flavihumibacter sp.]